MHFFNPSTQDGRGKQIFTFKASLVSQQVPRWSWQPEFEPENPQKGGEESTELTSELCMCTGTHRHRRKQRHSGDSCAVLKAPAFQDIPYCWSKQKWASGLASFKGEVKTPHDRFPPALLDTTWAGFHPSSLSLNIPDDGHSCVSLG